MVRLRLVWDVHSLHPKMTQFEMGMPPIKDLLSFFSLPSPCLIEGTQRPDVAECFSRPGSVITDGQLGLLLGMEV